MNRPTDHDVAEQLIRDALDGVPLQRCRIPERKQRRLYRALVALGRLLTNAWNRRR